LARHDLLDREWNGNWTNDVINMNMFLPVLRVCIVTDGSMRHRNIIRGSMPRSLLYIGHTHTYNPKRAPNTVTQVGAEFNGMNGIHSYFSEMIHGAVYLYLKTSKDVLHFVD
jgi:hypothetical protein